MGYPKAETDLLASYQLLEVKPADLGEDTQSSYFQNCIGRESECNEDLSTTYETYENSLIDIDADILFPNLQGQLTKMTSLLTEKSNMENNALEPQTNSLKDALNMTKTLLEARTSEVVELSIHKARLEEKIRGKNHSLIAIMDDEDKCTQDNDAGDKQLLTPLKRSRSGAKTPTTSGEPHQENRLLQEAIAGTKFKDSEKDLQLKKTQEELLKITNLLEEKNLLCSNLEKQNFALNSQANLLKDVVAITKRLLSVRTSEVVNMCLHVKKLEEKLHAESEKYSNCYNQMKEAIKINEDLKSRYEKQMELFQELCLKYEEKVSILEADDRRLS